jgi:hypothetical protein
VVPRFQYRGASNAVIIGRSQSVSIWAQNLPDWGDDYRR